MDMHDLDRLMEIAEAADADLAKSVAPGRRSPAPEPLPGGSAEAFLRRLFRPLALLAAWRTSGTRS